MTISEQTAAEEEEAFRKEYNEAHPSEEPLTGQLSEDQKRIVEERANTRFEKELESTYEGVTKKAELLIKLQLPAAFKRRTNTMRSKLIS